MTKLNWFDWLCLGIVIVGAINAGLIGFFNFNLITTIFGTALFTRVLYAIAGLAGIYCLYVLNKISVMAQVASEKEERERLRRVA